MCSLCSFCKTNFKYKACGITFDSLIHFFYWQKRNAKKHNVMKIKGLQFLVSTAAALILSSYILYKADPIIPIGADGKGSAKEKIVLKALMESVNANHFDPRTIDDKFSEDVYGLYLERMDMSKRFLLKQDVKALEAYKLQIDDQIKSGDFKFFDLSYEILQKRFKEASEFYQTTLSKPFNFNEKEEIELDEEKRDFATNRDELKQYWRQLLKYQVLSRVVEMEEKQNKAQSDTVTILSREQMEEKARAAVLKSNQRYFERMTKWTRDDQQEVFINSIMNVFEPHTGYFPPKDKENFDISMSGQLEGIGAQLQERDGFIRVSNIVPGSPSYRQGELEEGDLIIKVAQGEAEPIDVTDMRLDDAVKLIRGKKGTEVRLTVKKISGATKIISIIRDVVVLEETYAKSAIVENESGIKVGYIFLPKFYADFNRMGGRAAAEDVKIELEKLNAEGVQGVVLDLRGNGGGSLRDAIDITGHFIETGPVVQVKSRFSRPEIMSDNNRSVVFDGPLVVMVNHFSASASEIVAAAIQDYDRGVIMGASQSFGKGTVQRFFELDQMLTPANAEFRPLGSIKITTQKFYRINGGATQLRGVVPDIITPDQYNYIDLGEKEQDFVMKWDEIDPASYKTWKRTYNKELVLASSVSRMEKNEILQLIDQKAHLLKERSEKTAVSLEYNDFVAYKKSLDEEDEEYEGISKPIESLQVKNLVVDAEVIATDTVKADINEKWLKKLKKDQFLNEAVYIIKDMDQSAPETMPIVKSPATIKD